MALRSDADDTEADSATPNDEQRHEPRSSPILPMSMQQRLAAWDDEDRHKDEQEQQHTQQGLDGVWLSVDEREAMEVEWLRQVEEVKEAWRAQAEHKERERERQHRREKETWQAIEDSRHEREKAEELIHAQRRQRLDEEDQSLQRAIDERTQQLHQLDQQIQQRRHADSSATEHRMRPQQNSTEQEADEKADSEQQQQPQLAADEMRAALEAMGRRMDALREEEGDTRRRMREERRQLNRDNMALLLAIERNRQRLQQEEPSDNQQVLHAQDETAQAEQHAAVPSTPLSHTSASTSPHRCEETRALRQQLADERRRVEALQQRRGAAEQHNRTLQARHQQLKDDTKQHDSRLRAKLSHERKQWQSQLSEAQQHSTRLQRTVQSLQQRVEELDDELAAVHAQRHALKRMDSHRLATSGESGSSGKGKENCVAVRKAPERSTFDEDDGLDGLVDGLQGLRQTQAALHSRLRQQHVVSASPSGKPDTTLPPMSARLPVFPLPAPVSQADKSPLSPATRSGRQLVVPLSPALSTVSSIADEADMSCCHPKRPSLGHSPKQQTKPYVSIRTSQLSLSAARCMR